MIEFMVVVGLILPLTLMVWGIVVFAGFSLYNYIKESLNS